MFNANEIEKVSNFTIESITLPLLQTISIRIYHEHKHRDRDLQFYVQIGPEADDNGSVRVGPIAMTAVCFNIAHKSLRKCF